MNKNIYLYVLLFFIWISPSLSQNADDINLKENSSNDPPVVADKISNPFFFKRGTTILNSKEKMQYRAVGDLDNDGVPDEDDLDDDNDGILDVDECNVSLSFANYAPLTAGTNLNNLQVNNKVLYTNAVIYDGVAYDIVMTITAMLINGSGSKVYIVSGNGFLALFKGSSIDQYVKFNFSLVESGSATAGNPTGTPASIPNFILMLDDMDSYSSQDIGEVVGYETGLPTSPDSSYLAAITTVENAGFRPGQQPPGNYNYYRLDPATAGNPSNWYDEGPVEPYNPNQERSTVYLSFNNFTSVNLLFGAIGSQNIAIRYTSFKSAVVCDEDNDNVPNVNDLDSDNDGIPDNIEAQPTVGYVAPPSPMVVNADGIPVNYAATPLVLVDTDGDGIKDFKDTNSDNDALLDIEENGMVNVSSNLDADLDGLDDNFEGGNLTDPADVNDEIDTPLASILPDGNGDVLTGGDLDYRDIFNDITPGNAVIDFDGVDDYVSSNLEMKGYDEATIMGWVKLDANFSNAGTIVGENIFRLSVDRYRRLKLKAFVYSNSLGTTTSYELGVNVLNKNQWYHVAGVYNSVFGYLKLYLNGKEVATINNMSQGSLSTATATASPSFALGRLSSSGNYYFKGSIDEVRVFNKALTASQVQKMVYQEISNDGGVVKGKIVPKRINDKDSDGTLPWSSLQAYYPMATLSRSETDDESSYGRTATLHNILTLQKQTAPMPFTTAQSGSWSDPNTWVNGAVSGISDMEDWSIVKLSHNATINTSHETSALVIDPGVTLTVNGDNAIINRWYLKLDGTIDLQNDSQLIQLEESDLETSASGKVLRRQEATSNSYWYNHFASPVGAQGVTALSNNNGVTNNPNNSAYNLGMLKDASGSAMSFTNEKQEQGKISRRWLNSFANGSVYGDWQNIDESTALVAGSGYSQKGTGVSGSSQGYLFEGKPNNGTIVLNAVKSSNPYTGYLVGNPYASAIDARQFISDNLSVIDGTLYLWEQWAGNSHVLGTYEGGYGTINLTTTVRAYQYPDIPIVNQEDTQGVKLPTYFLPVGQGFFVEIQNTGDIVFKNSQRAFIKEADADGLNPENGSVFMRGSGISEERSKRKSYNSDMSMIRLEFKVSSGASRHIVVAFSDKTTELYDNGYDAYMTSEQEDDISTRLGSEAMVIQAYPKFTLDKEVPLSLNATSNKMYSLSMVESKNLEEGQAVYLKDELTGEYIDLRGGKAYDFTSLEVGTNLKRFSIVFEKESDPLEGVNLRTMLVYLNQTSNLLYIKNTEDAKVSMVSVKDMLGKEVKVFKDISEDSMLAGLSLDELERGTYIVRVQTDTNTVVNKKIVVN